MNKIREIAANPRSVINISFIIVLIFVGIMLNIRLNALMYEFSEGQVARQAEIIAENASASFGSVTASLRSRAGALENQEEEIVLTIMGIFNRTQGGMSLGLTAADGTAVFGMPVSAEDFPAVQDAFRGNGSIGYHPDKGLIFCYPVFNGDNIRYVLYELYPVPMLQGRFGVHCYGGQGRAAVISGSNKVIVPFADGDPAETGEFLGGERTALFTDLAVQLENSGAVSKQVDIHGGKYFVFASAVSGTDYYLIGFVPEAVGAAGANDITSLVTNVFMLLTVLFIVGLIYLMLNSRKLRENEELVKGKQVAEEASRAKSEFLASMSHEIRTPINAILGMDELILREYRDPGLRKYALNIRNAGNTLMSIINDILDFSKIESGKMKLVPVEYDVSLMIYDLVTMVKPRAEQKGLDLIVRADERIPSVLYGDNIRIKQCVLNILTNAVKYTNAGSVTLTVTFTQTDDTHIKLRVSVKDTGIGIKPEDIERLFQPFERVDLTRNRSVEGTGLGMSIVKNLLAMMDSRIEAESEYGKGSVFSFEVLQEIRSRQEMGSYESGFERAAEKKSEESTHVFAPAARILIVDDIEMNLTVAAGLLKPTGITVDTALSAKEGLALAANHEYDVIFIDDRMPGMSGVEMLRKLREDKNSICCEKPCIVLTANVVSGARDSYMKEGFEDYLSKPIDAGELERTLFRYLPENKVTVRQENGEKPEKRSGGENGMISGLDMYIGDDERLYDAVRLLMDRTSGKH